MIVSTPTEIHLTWGQPAATDSSYSIEYYVSVYRIADNGTVYIDGERGVNLQNYTLAVNESDPEVNLTYKFVVVPRYNVEGAKNGTPRVIEGHFTSGTFIYLYANHVCKSTS